MDAKNTEDITTTTPATHPLQDINLDADVAVENIRIPSPSALSATKAAAEPAAVLATKKNWVKFDDEVNSNANVNDIAGSSSTKNRLSPLPPPPLSETQRSNSRSTTPSRIEQQPADSIQTAVVVPDVQQVTSASVAKPDVAPAVLDTESTHVNLNASGNQGQAVSHPLHQQQQQNQKFTATKATATPTTTTSNQQSTAQNGRSVRTPNASTTIAVEPVPTMRTIELSTGSVREGFANGDVIVTLLPANTRWPWITPAIFRPELVPEELMAQGLTLTVEDYVMAMETLVNDYRFTSYNICYKRVLVVWILFAFSVLLALLFSGLQGMALFVLGVGWLFINAAAIFICMWVKLRLARGLEKCLARVNRQLIKHKILLVLDDRGRVSCHKVNLCFLYFDAAPCINFLNEFLEQVEQNGGETIKSGWESKLDIDLTDIVIQGSQSTRVSRKQERGTQLYLRYASRWGMDAVRGLLNVTPTDPGRHCRQFQCPCQFIKEHLLCKPRDYPCSWIAYGTDPQFQSRI